MFRRTRARIMSVSGSGSSTNRPGTYRLAAPTLKNPYLVKSHMSDLLGWPATILRERTAG